MCIVHLVGNSTVVSLDIIQLQSSLVLLTQPFSFRKSVRKPVTAKSGGGQLNAEFPVIETRSPKTVHEISYCLGF